MSNNDNVALLQKAISYLDKRYEEQQRGVENFTPINFQSFFDLLAPDAVFEIPCTRVPPEDDALSPPFDVIGRVHRGKQAIIDAFIRDQSDMGDWEVKRPLQYFANGDRVVVLHAERYIKQGVPLPWAESVMVFEFRDGLIVRYTHIADLSGHIAACQPDGR